MTPVQKGIMLLDEHAPGWKDKIDTKTLDLSSCTACVLGQVFGGYVEGIYALNLKVEQGTEFGFNIVSLERTPSNPDFIALKKDWIDALAEKGCKVRIEEPGTGKGKVELRELVTV